MNRVKRIRLLLALFFSVCMTLSSMTVFATSVQGAALQTVQSVMDETATYLYATVKTPQVGSIGGEWAVLGIARSGYDIPKQYYEDYYDTVAEYVRSCGGILHEKKYSEYSRLIVALTAIGADPSDVGGYNLLTPLGDFDKTIWQGINGPIWALIALDSGNYLMPQNPSATTQATRQMYVDEILSRQLPDGGFSLLGGTDATATGEEASDPDITGMALQALAKYQDQEKVRKVTDEALSCLSKLQKNNGGFASRGPSNSESCAQVIVALTELGISLDDSRFVKNSNTLIDNLLTFHLEGKGFFHTLDGSGSNQMATEQAFYGLVAAERAATGKNSLYRMGDAAVMILQVRNSQNNTNGEAGEPAEGLPGRNSDVTKQKPVFPGKTFPDISDHKNQLAIEALAARNIIDGKTADAFIPDATMTRAEFSTIVTKALGLDPAATDRFPDVSGTAWYAPYVGTASRYGIINGNPDGSFNPQAPITKQEAAVMVTRAAELCGMDIAIDAVTVREVLSQFPDYVTVAEWAKSSMAYCYEKDILSQDEIEIRPAAPIKRGDIAEMLFRMLTAAELI